MTSGFIRVPADDAGKRVDTATLTDELVEVHRQKMVISGGSGTAEVVVVTNAAPAGTDMGLVVRQAGTATVTGTVNVNGGVAISGTAIVAGTVNVNGGVAISGTAQVAIGTPIVVNNISATVVVSGLVGLTAGTAVIGDINAISRTVQVAVGTPFTLQGISTTVLVAVSTPFTLNNISATTIVAGNINISTMPAVTIAAGQTLNNISASVQVATGAVADFNTSADTTQNLPLIGIAQSAAGGAVAWGGSVTIANNVNISNTPSVVLATGTANFGTLNDISRTVQVAIGTPFTLQGISTTVTVAGVVGLTAGTAVIGDINAISRTVQVAIGTPFTIQGISTTVTVAGNINLSATAAVGLAYVTEKTTGSLVPVGDSANAAIRVNVVAGAAGGVSQVDGTPFTAQEASFAPMGGVFDDVAPGTLSEGDAGVVRMTTNRAIHTNMRIATGAALDDTANTALRVNVVAGGGAGGGTSTADRSTFTPGTTAGTPAQGTYNTTAASISDGEAAAVRITLNRAFHVNLRDNSGGEITASNPLSVKVERTSATDSVVLAAGTANIGTLNNISATVIVAGNINISATPSVILAAGTANFGTLNDISKTVQVAIATPYILQGISTTVQVAVGTPFTVNNISATVTVAGSVVISSTATVAGVVGLTAGTANIGFINNISASVVIATGASFDFNTLASADQVQNVALFGIALPASGGASVGGTNSNPLWVNINTHSQTAAVVLAAGTANFGTLNDISRTVQVAIGTPFTLQGISTTVTVVGVVSLAAGTILDSISATVGVKGQVSLGAGTSNIGFINNISATVTVAGNINISATPSVILAAGTANFGTLNDISRTVQVAIATPYILQGISTTVTTVVSGYTPAVMSASRGPKCVTASTSSNVTLIASPGAGANIYVTRLMVGNFSSTLTRARIGTSASISTIVQPLAASGGGFVLDFDPPWMLSASEAALCSVKPNVADAFFTVHFFVK